MPTATWTDAPDLRELAQQVIAKRDEVSHVDIDEVTFLYEMETTPKAIGRCYNLVEHPQRYYDPTRRFAIVFYNQHTQSLSERQRAILMLHELMHIPILGDKLVDHDVKDFARLLRVSGVDWAYPGEDVPDILGEEVGISG